ncbi:MAG TPA: tetratricopeptide repeat protein, partial [Pirellula sp.]|nr:tetratricopeptide repeat protein [Pirellula sp.]
YADLANEEIKLAHEVKTDSEPVEPAMHDEPLKRMTDRIDMLYRRVLQLNQNNAFAKFYVANQMTRYGSRGSARQIMESLAPADRNGFQQAHAWLAADLIERGQKGESIDVGILKQHLKRATASEEVSPGLLLVYSQLLQQENKIAESQEYLKRAAKFDPKLLLTSVAIYNQNGQANQAKATADLLVERVSLKDKKGDVAEDSVILVAQAYALTNRIDTAVEVLQSGLSQVPQSPKLLRALSDAFRYKFRSSFARSGINVRVNLEFLNAAIALDPTNIAIQEDLNALKQLGIGSTDSSVQGLRLQIATLGTSFVARLILAESSVRRGDLASAINDYEVVLAELPQMTLALNNLAMLHAQSVPPKFDESLKLIDRAIEISPTVSEFHDSRGDILVLLKRREDAVTSYLQSLESTPQRVQTREKLISLYEELSLADQAQVQRDKLEEIQKAMEEQRLKMEAATEQQKQLMKSEKPPELETQAEEDPAAAKEPE